MAYTLAHPDADGCTVLILTPLEFLQRLAHLVPPPRRHLVRYWGVLAPNAPLRARVIALAAPASQSAPTAAATEAGAQAGADPEPQGKEGKGQRASSQRTTTD